MLLRCFLFIPFVLFVQISVFCQVIVRGKVSSQAGEPLSGVTVTVVGQKLHSLTDDQGRFDVKVRPGAFQIECSYSGFVSQTFTGDGVNASPFLNISLLPSGALDQVNVSGVKKKSATATRTLLQIQDIPQSVVVMGQKVIQEQGAFDLTTITRNISGLNYTGSYGGSGSYQFFNARGFDLSNSQNYRWNGQMIWNLGNNYADNIEQVEFLKGPTSILFGDISPGGVLNFVSKQPLHEFYARADVKVGQWGLVRPAIDISAPLTQDKTLRFRLNTSYEQSSSFRDFVKEKRFLIAPTIAWDVTKDISVTLETIIRHSSSTDDAGLVSPDGSVSGLKTLSPHLYLGEPDRKYLFSDQSFFLTSNWNISKSWRVRMVNFYGHTSNRPDGIWPGQPDSAGNIERSQYGYHQWLKNWSTSIDIMGIFFTGGIKHNVVVGVDAQSTQYRYTADGSLSFFDSNNIFHPVYGQTPDVAPPTQYLPLISKLERAGFYAQDQLMFFKEKLHLLLGVRAGRTRQGNHYYPDQLAGTAYEGYQDDFVKKNVVTPRIGLVYKPVPDLSFYGSWSKGYEINSPDLFAQNYTAFINPPPTLSTQFEFGAKASVFNKSLGVSLSFFRIDKHDPYGYTYVTDSAGNIDYDRYNVYYQGHHRSEGIELDADGKISRVFSITAGAAYTRTRVIEDPGYPAGNQLPNAPRWSGNTWINYEAVGKLKGLTLGTGVFYKDKFFSTIGNDSSLVIPANYTVDFAAGYHWKQWGAQLNISNLTNRVSYLNPWAFVIYDVQPLRRAVLSLTYQIGKITH